MMTDHNDQPFTAAQSREIDNRIVEMVTAIMGEGEYASRCREIASFRARRIEAYLLSARMTAAEAAILALGGA